MYKLYYNRQIGHKHTLYSFIFIKRYLIPPVVCSRRLDTNHVVLHLRSQRGYGGVRYFTYSTTPNTVFCLYTCSIVVTRCDHTTIYFTTSSYTHTRTHSSFFPSLKGFCRSPPLMVAGGRVFVIPCVQQIQR